MLIKSSIFFEDVKMVVLFKKDHQDDAKEEIK
jgi:hypothetical protein